jgi:Ran GTPase-activating protein (RanGAP) involved in mRNA processing and transport
MHLLKLAPVSKFVDIQILDLSNNELGSETPTFLDSLIDSLIYLNLSNTKLGNKGACELAKQMRDEGNTKRCTRGKLRYLDISHNNIGSVGFLKILGRLKKSQTLVSLCANNNDFSERPNQFGQLENLLK